MSFPIQILNSKKLLRIKKNTNEQEIKNIGYFYILFLSNNTDFSSYKITDLIYNKIKIEEKIKIIPFKNNNSILFSIGTEKQLEKIQKEAQSFIIKENILKIPTYLQENNNLFCLIGSFIKKTIEGNVSIIEKNQKNFFFLNKQKKKIEIKIIGLLSFVEKESVNIINKLNNFLKLKTIKFEIESFLKAAVLGPRKKRLSLFMILTKTKIYMKNDFLIEENFKYTTIFISGMEKNVYLAEEKIKNFCLEVKNKIQKETFFIPKDSLNKEKSLKLNKKLKEFGVFLILFETEACFYCENKFCIKKIKEELKNIIFSNEIIIIKLETETEYDFMRIKIENILKKIKCNVLISEENIIITGQNENVFEFIKNVYYVKKEKFFKVKYIIENPIETKEFLCGKKNGKMLNIIKKTNVTIQIIESKKNGKWKIEINGDFDCVFKCVKMIKNEFLAMESFYIDPKYHKELIGNNGQNIQKLIKEYCVYIKFFEQNQAAIYFGKREYFLYNKDKKIDNVLMKTPLKNKDSFYLMKKKIMENIKVCQKKWIEKDFFLKSCYFFWLINFLEEEINVEFILSFLIDQKIKLKIIGETENVNNLYERIQKKKTKIHANGKKKIFFSNIEHKNNLLYHILSKKKNISFEIKKPFIIKENVFVKKEKKKKEKKTIKEYKKNDINFLNFLMKDQKLLINEFETEKKVFFSEFMDTNKKVDLIKN